MLYTLITHVVY